MNLKTLLRAIPVILVSATIGTALAAPKKVADPAASPSASASADTTAKKRTVSPDALAKARLTRLKNQVGLTADQETKAKPIIDKYVADRAASKGDKTKLQSLKTQYDSDIAAILTPEQKTKLSAAQAENKAKLAAGRAKKAAEKAAASPAASPAKSN
jgi:hypothetical protein